MFRRSSSSGPGAAVWWKGGLSSASVTVRISMVPSLVRNHHYIRTLECSSFHSSGLRGSAITGTPTQNHSPSSARSPRKTSPEQTDILVQDKIQSRTSGGAQPSKATNKALPLPRIQARIQAPIVSYRVPVTLVLHSPEILVLRPNSPS